MNIKDQIKHLRKIQAGINKHLFLICSIVTVLAMVTMTIEFFSRGTFPPISMNVFYLGVLIIYSLHKELLRWLGKRKVERQGEYFIYVWIGLTTLLYLINFISKDYFNYSAQGQPLTVLRDFSILTLEVLVVFILTRCLKILKVILVKQNP